MNRKILIIEDNQDLARLLEIHLKDMGFDVELAFDGIRGLARAEAEHRDLIVLDIMLPGLDGLEVCRRLRQNSNPVPILMLTSKSSEIDRIVGLELGSDDYVTKPFSIRELQARIKAILRRVDTLRSEKAPVAQEPVRVGGLVIDLEKRTVTLNGKPTDLTAKEYDLLVFFARNPGKVFSRSKLLDQVWGYGHDGYEHTVNSHINRLRNKTEADPAHPRHILTVWGVGYKFAEPDADTRS
ncbi:MAG: response regulator transcription factor [Pseudomonadota bacterium]